MAANKTRPRADAVEAFVEAVQPAGRRADAGILIALMERITGEPAVLWGPSIIGFGSHHYRYQSGREGEMPLAAFSPRKPHLVVYVAAGLPEGDALRARLGKHKASKACLYINRLADVDLAVLEQIVRASVAHLGEDHEEREDIE